MGLFINEIKQSYSLSKQIAIDLNSILEKRNFLIHKFFKAEGLKFYSDSGRLQMLEYFGLFIDEVKRLDVQLNKYYEKYINRLGINEDVIEGLMSQLKQAHS